MVTRHTGGRATARGSALLIALIFLVLFASMAVAIAASSDVNISIARNRIEAHQAGALAEGGILLAMRTLAGAPVPGTNGVEDLHQTIASRLSEVWNNSTMLDAAAITSNSEGVYIPAITLVHPDGRNGTVELAFQSDGGATALPAVTVESTGRFGNAVRHVSCRMTTLDGWSLISRYGVAARSAIQMTGDARIEGANDPQEGSILSATYVEMEAITLKGGVYVSGDVAVCNPDATISKTGKVCVDGSEIYGAVEVPWPETDPALFEPFATNVLTTPPGPGTVLSNIRIPANTNPTFNSDVVINGIVYIESPNNVKFNAGVSLTGLIVTEKADSLTGNSITFAGHTSVLGVENLPAGSEYDGLRNLGGSFLLAEGFAAKFTGSFTTLNGSMVASAFEFSGNAGGTICGTVVNLSDSYFSVKGTVGLTFDHDGAHSNPAGIVRPYVLVWVPGSYEE
jgi:hypothetical protein